MEKLRPLVWPLVGVCLVLWLLGLIGQVGGVLIWLPLVIATIAVVIELLSGKRAV